MTTTNDLSVGSATLPSMTNTQTASTDHIRIPDADLDRPIAATVPDGDSGGRTSDADLSEGGATLPSMNTLTDTTAADVANISPTERCRQARTLLEDAAKHARYAAADVADALITAPGLLDEREVKDVAAVLLAAENAVKRLVEAVAR